MADDSNIESAYASLSPKHQEKLWLSLTARARTGGDPDHDITRLEINMDPAARARAEKLWESKEDFYVPTPKQIMEAAAREQSFQTLVEKFGAPSAPTIAGHGLPQQQQARAGRSV